MVEFNELVKEVKSNKDKGAEDVSIEDGYGNLGLKMLNQEDYKKAKKIRSAIKKLLIEEDSDEEML